MVGWSILILGLAILESLRSYDGNLGMARMVRMFHASHPSAIQVLLGDVFTPSYSFSQTRMAILIIIQVPDLTLS